MLHLQIKVIHFTLRNMFSFDNNQIFNQRKMT